MARSKRSKKPKGAKLEVYGSDDERTYRNEPQPNPDDNSFFHDDIDNFHANREKILLDKGTELSKLQEDTDEEEVLGIGSDMDDDEIEEYEKRLRKFQSEGFQDELASDIEDEEKDEYSVDKAWGSARNKYYGADISDNENIDFSGSEPDTALLEEQEALAIQKRMAEQLDDEDFGLDLFKIVKKHDATKKEIEGTEEIIQKDLSKLTKAEKLQLLKKESPELLQLSDDYKAKMQELQERILPLQKLFRCGKLPKSTGADYIEAKVKLYLNYCINISFYMMLKAKRTPVESHPVIKRIVQYRNLIKEIETVDISVAAELDELLEKVKTGKNLEIENSQNSDTEAIISRKRSLTGKRKSGTLKERKKLSSVLGADSDEEEFSEINERQLSKKYKKEARAEGRYETKGEMEALDYYKMMKGGRTNVGDLESESSLEEIGSDHEEHQKELGERAVKVEQDIEDEEENIEEEEDGKRAITYQMAKNKGLTPKRKKEQRNPRVKHRNKYRKAKIRRKGQVREVRSELQKYGGEISGIRAGIKRSVKFK